MASLVRTAFPFLILSALAGCTAKSAVDPAAVAKLRERLTLAAEPAGVKTVSEVRTEMLGEAPPNVLALLEEHEHHDGDAEHADHHDDALPDEHHEEAHHQGEAPASAAKHSEMDVVMVGVVGGVPNPMAQTVADFPFAKDKAMFFLADPKAVAELEEHGHHHAPGEECSFCEAHAADAKALIAAVSFFDEHGRVVPIDARELFGLKEKQTIVVQGKAKAEPGGLLSVAATGFFVRK